MRDYDFYKKIEDDSNIAAMFNKAMKKTLPLRIVTMRLDNGVVFVNLTEVAKAFSDKNLSQIINSKEIQEYAAKLSAKLKIYSSADLLKVTRGGNGALVLAEKESIVAIRDYLNKFLEHFFE